jgi:hypothetical protein
MLEGKKSNLSIVIERCGYAPDVSVNVSFDAKLNSCCGMCSCGCFPQGVELSCLCHALAAVVHQNLCGTPLHIKKSKVASVTCGSANGKFYISYTTKGVASAVRKSLGIVLKCLVPEKVFSTYSRFIKQHGGSADRSVFNFVADEVTKSIKDKVQCLVVGNIKLEKKDPETKKLVKAIDVDAMLDILHKKLDVSEVAGSKTNPSKSDHKACDHKESTELKVSGWHAAIIRDFINDKVKGVQPKICDKYLLIQLKGVQWETQAAKIKKYAKDFVASKYDSLGNDMCPLLAYQMSNSISSMDICSMLKACPKASDLEKVITSVL